MAPDSTTGSAPLASKSAPFVRWRAPILLLGAIWLALGLAKIGNLQTLATYFHHTYGVEQVWASVGARSVLLGEIVLGLQLLMCQVSGRYADPRRAKPWLLLSLGASILVVVSLLAIETDGQHCGCFGSVVAATRARRLGVAGLIMALSAACLAMPSRDTEARAT